MSTEIERAIFERVKKLPLEQKHEVLHFVEKLTTAETQSAQTIWQEIREIIEDVPDEVWEQQH